MGTNAPRLTPNLKVKPIPPPPPHPRIRGCGCAGCLINAVLVQAGIDETEELINKILEQKDGR